MIYRDLGIHDLLERALDKTLICFGAGRQLINACGEFSYLSFFEKIDFIADNDKNIRYFTYNGVHKPVTSLDECIRSSERTPIILITVSDCKDLISQLDGIAALHDCECYNYTLMRDYVKPYQLPINRAEKEPLIIPKTIHYCWFGGNPMRDDFKAYIETWKKHCPDYDIVRWDESNYDYKKNEYMYDAYKRKIWGLVPDYARLDIIYRYGGVYLDTDVELIKNIDDLLCDEAFSGFEYIRLVNNGLGFGAVAGFPFFLKAMSLYNSISLFNADGSLNMTSGPDYHTEFMQLEGLVRNNTLQKFQGMTVYPSDVLSPLSFLTGRLNITDNTYAIHHYAGTWLDSKQRDDMSKRIERNSFLFDVFRS